MIKFPSRFCVYHCQSLPTTQWDYTIPNTSTNRDNIIHWRYTHHSIVYWSYTHHRCHTSNIAHLLDDLRDYSGCDYWVLLGYHSPVYRHVSGSLLPEIQE